MSTLLDAALELAGLGHAVVPMYEPIEPGLCSCGKRCPKPGKHPRINSWPEHASADSAQVRSWWRQWPNANVGLATGLVFDVLDVDGPEGETTLRRLTDEHGELPAGPVVRTGSGGWHYYFAAAGFGNSVGHLGPGLDWRGVRGLVVAPPSTHASGDRYQWISDLGRSIPDVPNWLLGMLDSRYSSDPEVRERPLTTATPEEGERNDTYFRLACRLRSQGFTVEEALALIRERNGRASAPLDDTELLKIIESSGRYPPPEESYECTEAGQADFVADRFGADLRFDHQRDSWMIWDGGLWVPDDTARVDRLMIQAARDRFARVSASTQTQKEQKKETTFAVSCQSNARIRAVRKILASHEMIADSGQGWDRDPMLLGVGNGVVHLADGRLTEGERSWRMSIRTRVRYEPLASAPRFERFLNEVFDDDPELVEYIQRAVGYTLTGDCSEQAVFFAHGSGANGKSVFLGALHHVFGDYAFNVPFSTLERARFGRSASNDIAAMEGRRFVMSSETNEGTVLDEARLKSLTGGDKLTARFMYHEFTEFDPTAKIWLAMNHLPVVRDTSWSFWRRLHLVPFLRTFGPADAELGLDEQLRREEEGILAWAVRGAIEWRRRGLDPPPAVVNGTEAYRADSDDFAEFLDECCERRAGARSRARQTYQRFQAWASDAGWGTDLSEKDFARKMKQHGFASKRGGRGNHWVDLELRPEPCDAEAVQDWLRADD